MVEAVLANVERVGHRGAAAGARRADHPLPAGRAAGRGTRRRGPPPLRSERDAGALPHAARRRRARRWPDFLPRRRRARDAVPGAILSFENGDAAAAAPHAKASTASAPCRRRRRTTASSRRSRSRCRPTAPGRTRTPSTSRREASRRASTSRCTAPTRKRALARRRIRRSAPSPSWRRKRSKFSAEMEQSSSPTGLAGAHEIHRRVSEGLGRGRCAEASLTSPAHTPTRACHPPGCATHLRRCGGTPRHPLLREISMPRDHPARDVQPRAQMMGARRKFRCRFPSSGPRGASRVTGVYAQVGVGAAP